MTLTAIAKDCFVSTMGKKCTEFSVRFSVYFFGTEFSAICCAIAVLRIRALRNTRTSYDDPAFIHRNTAPICMFFRMIIDSREWLTSKGVLHFVDRFPLQQDITRSV